MCGIVGFIDNVSGSASALLLANMRDVMVNRGPDGTGEFVEGPVALAMRRLSIIDLEHGWQPLKSRKGRVVVFQNGEIYNYKALRAELEQQGQVFITHSDTEVLAHGFASWGIDGLLRRVDGMYAFAVLDRNRGELYLARDRFGEKPLFYWSGDRRFAFSSDLRALAGLPWVDTKIDPVSLDQYLALHYVPGERTILNGIKRVLPGQYLCLKIDNLQIKPVRYYQVPIGIPQNNNSDEDTANILHDAVSSRMISDVPVGVFLSGGLDSSVIAAIAAEQSPRINTFSMGFPTNKHDDSVYAEQVARHVGSAHHHFMFDEARFAELLPQVAKSMDEPLGDQALLPLFWLCREARNHVKVVLSGEGADEIFAGYGYYRDSADRVANATPRFFGGRTTARNEFDIRHMIRNRTPITPSGFPLLTDAAGRQQLLGKAYDEPEEWEDSLIRWLDCANDELQRATSADLATWLPDDLLVKSDRMTMAHSLEGRAPYLDPKVVEAGLCRIPPHDRMSKGESKIALRRIARRWLPPSILDRPKQGFVLPMRKWLIQWFDAHNGPQGYFQNRSFPGINMEVLSGIVVADLNEGVRRERLLFAMVMLCEWYASFNAQIGNIRSAYQRALV